MKSKKSKIVSCDEHGCKYKVDISKIIIFEGHEFIDINDAAYRMVLHMQRKHKLDEDAAYEKINTMHGWPSEGEFLN